MEKYLMAILVLMPGFLAINTAEKLGKTHTKKSGVALALEYAVYTVVILLIAMSASLFWAADGTTMQQVACGEMSLAFYAAFLATAVLASVVSGAAWALYLSDWVLGRCNAFNKARGKNIRWEEGSLFHHLFNDGRPHFIIVRKDGEDVAVGFFDSCNDPQDEKDELSVVEFPEYREEWDLVKKGEKDSYLYITLRMYVDASSGLTVIETKYPPEWLSDRGKASREPEKGAMAASSAAKADSGADTRHDVPSVRSDS